MWKYQFNLKTSARAWCFHKSTKSCSFFSFLPHVLRQTQLDFFFCLGFDLHFFLRSSARPPLLILLVFFCNFQFWLSLFVFFFFSFSSSSVFFFLICVILLLEWKMEEGAWIQSEKNKWECDLWATRRSKSETKELEEESKQIKKIEENNCSCVERDEGMRLYMSVRFEHIFESNG